MLKSKDQLQKEAQRDLNTKLKLERILASGVRRFLKRQNKIVAEYASKLKMQFDASSNEQEVKAILGKHYTKVVKKFYPSIIRDANAALSSAGIEKIDRNDLEVIAALLAFIDRESTDGAARITERSNRDISKAFAESENDKEAVKKLKGTVVRRSQLIATEYTQRAAEGGKLETSNAIHRAAQGATFAAVSTMAREKTWMTRMDKDVREIHSSALFQSVLATLPFSVGGEQLMFPGDMSMGASIGNVANCRCSAIYSFRIL